jgi:transcription elongation factor Elf1
MSDTSGKFTCPRCGAHLYSSVKLADGTEQRVCRGMISGISCLYTWHEARDRDHGLVPLQSASRGS